MKEHPFHGFKEGGGECHLGSGFEYVRNIPPRVPATRRGKCGEEKR
jgi:hypothetical protein